MLHYAVKTESKLLCKNCVLTKLAFYVVLKVD